MKRFSQYISESRDFDADRFKALTKFFAHNPKRDKYYSPKFVESIDAMEAAFESGVIYNPVFNDVKSRINRFMEEAFGELKYTIYADKFRENQFADDADSLFSLRGANKQLKHFKQFENKYPLIVQFLEVAVDLNDAMKRIKPLIKKGAPPKPTDPNKFVKPMASADAQKQVMKILQAASKDIRSEYVKSMEKHLNDVIARLTNMDLKTGRDVLKIKDVEEKMVAQKVFDYNANSKNPPVLKSNRDVKQYVQKEAERRVDEILEHFVAKNTDKLALIFQKKEALQQHRILNNHVRNNIMENSMYFEFADNSSFKIYSQVEYGYTKYGKVFLRLPTRFTDVIMADGKKMRQPSEEKMVKEF